MMNSAKPRIQLSRNGQAVLAEVLRNGGHFSPEDLVRWGMDRTPAISRATIYRTLRRLAEGKVIAEVGIDSEQTIYELQVAQEHHDHLVCNSCGKILELQDTQLETRQLELCRQLGFRPTSHQLVIYGECPACQ